MPFGQSARVKARVKRGPPGRLADVSVLQTCCWPRPGRKPCRPENELMDVTDPGEQYGGLKARGPGRPLNGSNDGITARIDTCVNIMAA